MNITVFEFLKRFEIDGENNFVNIYSARILKKAGTLAELKAELGIEPFNPLQEDDIGNQIVQNFKITENVIKISI